MIVVNARFLTQKLTGVQRFAFELSKRLEKHYEDNILFLSPYNVLETEKAKELNVKVIGKYTGYVWEQIELPLHLKKLGNPILLNFCSVAPLMYKNNVVAVHDITYVRYPQTYSRKFIRAYNFLIPRLCRQAKRLITVSEFSKDEISDYYNIPKSKFTVVYNGVDNMFHRVDDESLMTEKYFLAVSSMKENKNFITAITAFNELNKKIDGIKLYVIGDLKDKNFRVIDTGALKTNNNIKFLGRVSDEELVRYYSNAIAFLFPSLYEGFGIPVLEAQACGCPVISSNTSSLPEVLQSSALMSPPTDISKFAELMKDVYLSKELRGKLILEGYNNIKRFSWDNSVKQVISIVDSLNT